jgi:hypothetical protein
MPFDTPAILEQLDRVEVQRRRRTADPDLGLRVKAVKHYQALRFAQTYADLLASARYRGAARYFLDELYGPQDFTERDRQLARVVPATVRLFPAEIVDVVGAVVSLHALSEELDSALAQQLAGAELDPPRYLSAWQATGQGAQRERQIALTLEVARALDSLVHKPFLRHSLRLMRGPARAAGLGDLQQSLERGFDTFRSMRGADEFVALIGQRERLLAATLFEAGNVAQQQAAFALLPAQTHTVP